MYQLLIQTPDGVWHNADFGKDAPAYSFVATDIADIQDRQANYSQAIELPITPNNARIFAYFNHPQTRATTPYALMPCRLFADGILIAGKGSVMKILSASPTSISAQILGGIVDIFDTLQNVDLTAVADTPEKDIFGIVKREAYDLTSPTKEGAYYHGALYSGRKRFSDKSYGLYYDAYPSMPFNTLVQKLCAHIGYTFVKDANDATSDKVQLLPTNTKGYKELGYTAAATTHRQQRLNEHSEQRTYNGKPLYLSMWNEVSTMYDFRFTINKDRYQYVTLTLYAYGSTTGSQPYPSDRLIHKGDVESEIVPQRDLSGNIMSYSQSVVTYIGFGFATTFNERDYSNIIIDDKGDAVYNTLTNLSNWTYKDTGGFIFTNANGTGAMRECKRYIITLRIYPDGGVWFVEKNKWLQSQNAAYYNTNDGKEVFMSVGISPAYYLSVGSCELTDPNLEGQEAMPGGSFSYTNNIGVKTGADLMKLYLQTFALMCKVDHNSKTITAVSWHTLMANKSKAVDWSRKLSAQSEATAYTIASYAQNNIIAATTNKKTEYQDRWQFTIPNNTLKKEATLYTLGVLSTQNDNIGYYTEQIDDDGRISYKFEALASPVMLYKEDSGWHASPIAKVLQESYRPLTKMLQSVMVLTAKVYLTAVDVANFDPFVPIFLEQYGAYFYVNKINNFIAGQLTEVELVRL